MIAEVTLITASIVGVVFILLIIVVFFLKTVQPNEVLVVLTKKGPEGPYPPGLRFVPPWRKFRIVDMRFGSYLAEHAGTEWVFIARCKNPLLLAEKKLTTEDVLTEEYEELIKRDGEGQSSAEEKNDRQG